MTDPTLHPHATVARGQHDVHDHGGTADDRVGRDARLSPHQMDGGHDHHAGNGHGGHDKHAGHDPEMFRRRFWLSLALTIPLVVTSEMVMDWFGYSLDFYGMKTLGPVLGSIVFWWGGWPFLAGGVREVRDRQPGMMLLISMAITVAYVASMATSLDWFDLDFWWELAALVTIMLLGHWQEMKAIGQAQGRSPRSPSCCPTTPSGSPPTARSRPCPSPTCASVTSCSCAQEPGFQRTARSSRARPSSMSR